ncbi:MAG: hypothetical protein LBN96_08725, partial [Desulfovibrio sp.]|nr:hypothetical protein [Desulfovibrio sp.]
MRPTKNALENPLNLRRAAPGKRMFPGVPGTLVLAAALCLGGAGAVLAAATEISLNGLTNGEKLEVKVDEIAKLDSGGEILPGGDFDNAGVIKITSGIMDLSRNRSTFATLRNSGQIDVGSTSVGSLGELVLGGDQLLGLIGRQEGGDAKGKLSVSNNSWEINRDLTGRIRVVDGVTLDTAWLTGSETQAEGTIALLLMAKNIIALEVEKGLTLTDDTGGTLLNVNGAIAVSGGVKLDDAITVQRGRLLLYDGELGGKDLKLGITTGSSNLALLDLGDASMPGSGGVVNTNVEVSRSAVNVNSGVWTLGSGKTLKFSNTGTLTIASGGVLNIGDGRLETTSGATLEVTNFGAVKADASSFGAYNPVNQTFSRLEQAFTVKAGGRLEVAGLHSIWTNNSISEEDLATARANLMVLTAPMPGQISRGLLDIGATEIIEILIDGGKVAYGALTDLGNVTNDALGAATVTGVNGNLSGEFKAVELAGNETRLTVTKTGLSLTGAAGAAGDPLIKKADGSPGDLHVVGSTFESGVVTLGDGAVGKVTLAGSDQNGIAGLNNVGEVNSGAIDSGNLSTSSSSVINVAGGKLTAASIGVDGPVNAVNVTAGGELTVAGDVKIGVGASKTAGLNAVGAKITLGGETTTVGGISTSHSMLTIDGTLKVTGGINNQVFRLTDGTRATVKKLDAHLDIHVGMPYDTVGSSLSVEELSLNGGMLLVDPAWGG